VKEEFTPKCGEATDLRAALAFESHHALQHEAAHISIAFGGE
jgi:hypothetical protein